MGQAKQRGTFEQRKAEAQQRELAKQQAINHIRPRGKSVLVAAIAAMIAAGQKGGSHD